jgi:DNA-binding MarR family transcriptional regulator
MIPSEQSPPADEDSVTHLVADWARERPDLDPLPIGVFARIHRLSSHLNNRTRGWLEAEGLTWEAFSLIATLRRQGPPYEMRPTEILRESLLTSGAVTNRIDKVEKMGLVERRADLVDGRASLVRLTKKGLDAANAAIEVHQAHLWEILGLLGADDLHKLDLMLARTLTLVEASGAARDEA